MLLRRALPNFWSRSSLLCINARFYQTSKTASKKSVRAKKNEPLLPKQPRISSTSERTHQLYDSLLSEKKSKPVDINDILTQIDALKHSDISAQTVLRMFSVKQLQAYCGHHKLSIYGRKEVLFQRIRKHWGIEDESKIEKTFHVPLDALYFLRGASNNSIFEKSIMV